MTEYERLREAFVQVCGRPVREQRCGQVDDNTRDQEQLCWIARNVWLHIDEPDGRDVQINAWQGKAWVSYNAERVAGLWCGLNIEYKPAFAAVMRFANADLTARIARGLGRYRVSFGCKKWPRNEFSPIDCGRSAADFDYERMFRAIPEFYGNGIVRPQLQVYRQIGIWLDSSNTQDRLRREIIAVQHELTELFRLVTGGSYPPRSHLTDTPAI